MGAAGSAADSAAKSHLQAPASHHRQLPPLHASGSPILVAANPMFDKSTVSVSTMQSASDNVARNHDELVSDVSSIASKSAQLARSTKRVAPQDSSLQVCLLHHASIFAAVAIY